jgi:hypothetical protein
MTFVDCWLLFFLWVVSTCVLICLVLMMDGFLLSLIFLLQGFSSKYAKINSRGQVGLF